MNKIVNNKLMKILCILVFLSVNSIYAKGIAVLNINEAILGTNYYKDFIEKSKPEFKKLEKQIEKLQGKIKSKVDSYKKNEATYSAKVKETKQKEVFGMEQKYRELLNQANQFQQKKNAELSKKMKPKLDKIIDKIVKEENYEIVLNKEGLVFYSKKENDITNEVKAKLDKLYKKEK